MNEKFEFRPYEFGNYPLRADGKPKNGCFRLMLPSDADWTEKQKKEAGEKGAEKEATAAKSPGKKGKK